MELILFLCLLVIGLVFGRLAESRHYRRICEREKACAHIPLLNVRRVPEGIEVASTTLATGSVVIAVDYFKTFLSSWRNIFGGEMRSYGSLLDRARREAILRMRESVPDADLFLNLRFETTDIGGKAAKAAPNVELFAFATAVRYRKG